MATGFLHPGAMGASLAAACTGDRLWCSTGRSPATRARAEAAGLIDVGTLEALVGGADTIVSVCPPTSAAAVADSVATLGFEGTYVDANAIAPATTRAIGERFARFVDGGVIGPPAKFPGTTRLYLSGADSSRIAELWTGSAVETRVVEGGVGAASAVKMCFAAWTKGTAALLLAIRALARVEGVELALLDEWRRRCPSSQRNPSVLPRTTRRRRGGSPGSSTRSLQASLLMVCRAASAAPRPRSTNASTSFATLAM